MLTRKRLTALLAAPLLILGGCSTVTSMTNSVGSIFSSDDGGSPEAYTSSSVAAPAVAGVVVADEPLAARAGAVVLAQNGSAVDAVTTMFFAMAATYPVAAGLGGGGICLVRDPATGTTREFDFLPRAASGGGAYAVPGAVRGFFDMQRAYGKLPWQRDVAPGEAYAATGFPVSAALAGRLVAAQNVIRLDASLAGEFLDESGQAKITGTVVTNPDLALTLSDIRLNGADGFYRGAAATRIAAYAAAQGGTVSTADMAAYASLQGAPRALNTGALTAWVPGPRTGAGAFTGALLDNLGRVTNQAPQAAMAGAVRQTLGGFGIASLPRDLGATGFVAVDATGEAAACAVTLNGPFGSGRTAAGTGMVLAASPATGQAGLGSAFLTPIIAGDASGVTFAGAGAGGPNGTAAIAYALLKAGAGQAPGNARELNSTGTAPFETVNLATCTAGVCAALSDPAGHGLGMAADTGPVAIAR